MIPIPGYALLDSGHGQKLERFGDKILSRLSSMCSWDKRSDEKIWYAADAELDADNGWRFPKNKFSDWVIEIQGVKLKLELQSNGQIGLFPEHALYLNTIASTIRSLKGQSTVKVLNLFAYTGLGTCFTAKLPDTFVTHVDLSKRALDWTSENLALNGIAKDRVRMLPDDALAFMAKEIRRRNKYDIIIIDPPSFSRISKNDSWTLEEKLPEICDLCLNVLEPQKGALFFTNHSSVNTTEVIRNIALDRIQNKELSVESSLLLLEEENSPRRLPAGALISLVYRS